MMLIVKITRAGFFKPRHVEDLPMFMHCTDGSIEVLNIAEYIPVFNNHGIQLMIQDETL